MSVLFSQILIGIFNVITINSSVVEGGFLLTVSVMSQSVQQSILGLNCIFRDMNR